MPGRGQGCSIMRLILIHNVLFFRCLAAVLDFEDMRRSQVVLTLQKFWDICTFFLARFCLQLQVLYCSLFRTECLGLNEIKPDSD